MRYFGEFASRLNDSQKMQTVLFANPVIVNDYWVTKTDDFVPGTIYTETPDDSGVASVLGMVDPSTGIITSFAIGFGKPTGMIFVPVS